MVMLWWILFIIWVVVGFFGYGNPDDARWRGGGTFLLAVLIGLGAYISFGWPFK